MPEVGDIAKNAVGFAFTVTAVTDDTVELRIIGDFAMSAKRQREVTKDEFEKRFYVIGTKEPRDV